MNKEYIILGILIVSVAGLAVLSAFDRLPQWFSFLNFQLAPIDTQKPVAIRLQKEPSQNTSVPEQNQKESSLPPNDAVEYATSEFKLFYPKDWWIQEDVMPNMRLALFSPQEGSDDTYGENVVIVIRDLSATTSNSLQAFVDSLLQEEKQLYGEAFTLESRESAIFSRLPAERLIFIVNKGINKKTTGKALLTATVNDQKGYIVTYVAREDTYDKFLKDAQLIINSFKID